MWRGDLSSEVSSAASCRAQKRILTVSFSKRTVEAFVKRRIAPALLERGFVLYGRALDYCSEEDTVSKHIGFGIARSRVREYALSVGAGVRFHEVERVAFCGKPGSEYNSTFGGLLHLLSRSKEYLEWLVWPGMDEERLAADILSAIFSIAFPFFDRYGKLEAVKEALASDNPESWLTYSHEGRLTKLAAILWCTGERTRALEMLDEAIHERRDKMPKYRYELEELRDYLRSERQRSL
jgi:hypothetical protein